MTSNGFRPREVGWSRYYRRSVTHYALSDEPSAWSACGIGWVRDHLGSTRKPERVTCRRCLVWMKRQEATT